MAWITKLGAFFGFESIRYVGKLDVPTMNFQLITKWGTFWTKPLVLGNSMFLSIGNFSSLQVNFRSIFLFLVCFSFVEK